MNTDTETEHIGPPAGMSALDGPATILDDPAWLAAEFAAIMRASGFSDRVIVGTEGPRSVGSARARDEPAGGHRAASTVVGSSHSARVRSPPSRSSPATQIHLTR